MDFDVGQTEQRDGAHCGDVRDSSHLYFDRNGDVPLDLLGRLTGTLRDDVDERRNRIRIRLDIQMGETDISADENQRQRNREEQPLLERERDD